MNQAMSSSTSVVGRFVQCRRPFGTIVIANGRHRCHVVTATRIIARRCINSSPSCLLPLGASTRLTQQQQPTIICITRMAFSTNNDDLDSLCIKQHLTDISNISIEEFAQGCKFLHQIALGNIVEVQAIVGQRANIVNFRDYDRRSKLIVCVQFRLSSHSVFISQTLFTHTLTLTHTHLNTTYNSTTSYSRLRGTFSHLSISIITRITY